MRSRLTVCAALALAGWACTPDQSTTPLDGPNFARVAPAGAQFVALMDRVNEALSATGAPYRAAQAEFISENGGGEARATLLQRNVGNQRLIVQFVPFDPRREWSGPPGPTDDITFAIDQTADAIPVAGSVTAAQATAAIRNAMATWNGPVCSALPLVESPSYGLDVGLAAFLDGLGGSPYVFADIHHAGWGDYDFEDGVIAATLTFIFTDDDGNPTDIDGDGRYDTALAEIYYDPDFTWSVGGGSGTIDIETVALHEAGHGLSQGHFGNLFLKGGFLMASPRAVMNAYYGGVLTNLLGTDEGGHCNIWGTWPVH